ncbi:MAG: glycosyltransferase family 2 protein [Ignavibacteria bacterium]|nr:glycosyltransferase family 2 protein [Ignavibacteria bacterium]
MKLIIQIPCYNEEATLPTTLRDLPKQIPGVDAIEVLVIDDGSTDRTAEVAQSCGVHHIVRLTFNQGLATAFAAGLEKCLELGADIIVNTDADNQYRGEDIRKLVQPILEKKADIVIGSRDIMNIGHFSPLKKLLQRVGSSFVRTISNTKIPDVTSGFRAYDRDAAMRLNVFSDFTYTLETLIQAGIGGLSIAHVQVQTNEKLRESRLFSSMSEYVSRSLLTVILIYTMYNPLRVFTMLALIFSVPGVVLVLRFFYFYISLPHVQTGHIQSLIIAAVLLVIGFQILLFGLLSDITAKNRKLMEDVLIRIKKQDLDARGQRHGT